LPAILLTVSENSSTQLRVLADGDNTVGDLDLQGLGSVGWLSHVGLMRARNEDRFLVKTVWDGEFLLLLVADGAGGHEAGDAAAAASVSTFDELFPLEGDVPEEGDPRIWLHDAILLAHDRVVDLATSRVRPPASTLVGVLIEKASLCAWRFHVGDSRLYVRGLEGMVSQWTRDHNITNGLIDRGLSVDQAMKIADGGRLTQVVGGTSDISPEIHGPLALVPGQVLLLCSDGIYGHNEDPEILPSSMTPGFSAAAQLGSLEAGVLGGGAPDNLTAVLWQIDSNHEATLNRETLTNSMPSLSAEAIQSYIKERNLAEKGAPDEDDRPTDSNLLPEDAPTMDAIDAHVPTSLSSEEEDTLNTGSGLSESVPSARAVELVVTETHRAVGESARDTRTAFLLILCLFVVLFSTYTKVVGDMRGDRVATKAPPPPELLQEDAAPSVPVGDSELPEAEELPDTKEFQEDLELPGEPEFPDAEELPGDPELSDREVELPDVSTVQLPGEVELSGEPSQDGSVAPQSNSQSETELPGEPAVEDSVDLELPDPGPSVQGDLDGAPAEQ
jgi:serine/threonine protein phosphatase PrpC